MNATDNEQNIRRLLDLYYEGKTSPQQTAALRESLEQLDPLPADLAADLALLRLCDEAAASIVDIPVPDALEQTLRDNIHRMAVAEEAPAVTRRIRRHRLMRRLSIGVAAATFLLLGTTFVYRQLADVEVNLSAPADAPAALASIDSAAATSATLAAASPAASVYVAGSKASASVKTPGREAVAKTVSVTAKVIEPQQIIAEQEAAVSDSEESRGMSKFQKAIVLSQLDELRGATSEMVRDLSLNASEGLSSIRLDLEESLPSRDLPLRQTSHTDSDEGPIFEP